MSIPHRYRESGTYTLQLAWRDQHGAGNSGTLTTTVRNVAPTVDAGGNATARAGLPFVRLGDFRDPGADTWTATVDYGDGSGPQSLDLRPGNRFFLRHRYEQPGTYTVTVTVIDDDGGIGRDTFAVVVLPRSGPGLNDVLGMPLDDEDRP